MKNLMIIASMWFVIYSDEIEQWLVEQCASLLRAANACSHPAFVWWKTVHFYPLKESLLKQFGTFTGYARQEIEKGECYACLNYREDAEPCSKCGGTGIYKETYYLKVYELSDMRFMVPLPRERRNEWPPPEPVILTIEGRTQHGYVSFKQARRSVIILFMLFDIRSFLWHTRRELHNLLLNKSTVYFLICEEIELQVMLWKQTVNRDNDDYDYDVPF